jgi:hypothetical protein
MSQSQSYSLRKISSQTDNIVNDKARVQDNVKIVVKI